MNKKAFHSVSLYSLTVVLAVIVLTVSAIVVSMPKSASKYMVQTLTTSSASDLKVQDTAPASAPSVSDDGTGNASSSGVVTLQAGQATAVPGGVAYPCNSCPEASSTTDVMICSDYCINPTPEPTPTPNPTPYPACDPCNSNSYNMSGKPVMCPMIACRYPQ